MSSLKASGGVTPAPKSIRLEELPEGSPIFHPETANQLPGTEIEAPPRPGLKKILKIAGSLVLIIALGFLGYFVIYPVLFPAPLETDGFLTRPAPEVPVPKAPAAVAPHKSLFVEPSPIVKDLFVPQATLLDVIAALQTEARVSEPAGTMKELAIKDGGGQISFSKYLNALSPQIEENEISLLFENDFTGFLYYDRNGIWPGYMARLRPGISQFDAEALLSRLEEGDIRLFYVADPGVHQGFADGPYKGYRVRYARFSVPGASFNYGLVGDYAVLAGSFDALKAAINQLGL